MIRHIVIGISKVADTYILIIRVVNVSSKLYNSKKIRWAYWTLICNKKLIDNENNLPYLTSQSKEVYEKLIKLLYSKYKSNSMYSTS